MGPIIDTPLLKLSFSPLLCVQQFLWFALICCVICCVIWGAYEYFKSKEETEQQNYWLINQQAEQLHQMREREMRERDVDDEEEDQSEKRRLARQYKIDHALSVRTNQPSKKLCKQCGAIYGNGATCQYCGQP